MTKLYDLETPIARHCVKEWVPTPWEKDNGHGTGVGMRVAEDRLIREVRKELA